jgi:hypothetical protein
VLDPILQAAVAWCAHAVAPLLPAAAAAFVPFEPGVVCYGAGCCVRLLFDAFYGVERVVGLHDDASILRQRSQHRICAAAHACHALERLIPAAESHTKDATMFKGAKHFALHGVAVCAL